MASRSIELILKAEVGQMVAGLRTARDAVNATSRDMAGFVRNNQQDMRTAGTAVATFGAGLTALSVGAVKAAIDWESSWADVQKVNDGTHEQMTRLEEDLREMARTIPATHEEIAAVAEAAGRLGVGVDDVADFSRVMIDLGNTTDLSADQAATAIARFSNIAGTSFSDADRLGSTIVDLGNNFATTESEIVEMSQRLAAAGSQAGLSEGEIMGLATAMSSVGIEAQAGGTAMTQTFNEIDAAVRKGGDSLDGWAELAGTTASEFADAWRNDPAEAIDLVIQGLAGVNESGGDVAGTLDDLGISGIRQADVMRRLASASDVAGDAMAMGNEAFAENSALTDEAAIRYDTAAMKIKTAWASIVDVAITAGSALAPVVGNVAEMAGSVADAFGKLPDPVLGAVTALSGVAGVASLGAGGLLLLAPRAVETYDAFKRLKNSTGGLPTALRNVGKGAGIAAGALAGLLVLDSLTDNFNEAVGTAEEFETQLRLLKDGAKEGAEGLDELFKSRDYSSLGLLPTGIRDLDSAINSLDTGAFMEFLEEGVTLFGLLGDTAQDLALEGLGQLDDAMSNMVSGGELESAAAGFEQFATAAEEAGWSTDRIIEATPEYAEALKSMASEQGYALEGAELYQAALGNLPPELQNVKEAADDAARQDELTSALEEVGVAADGTVDSLSDYLDMLFQTGLAEQSAMQAQASYQESLDGVSAAVDQITESQGEMGNILNDAKDGFDVTSEAGRTAQAAFIDVASSGMDMATAMAEAGESQETIQAGLQGTYDELINAAGEFGITGDAAEELARSVLGVPEGVDIETWMDETAQDKANELGESLDAVPEGLTVITEMDDTARAKAFETGEAVDAITGYRKVDVAISEDGTAGQVQSKVDSITGKTEYVFVTDDGTTTTVQQQIVNIDGVNRTVYVDDAGTIYATQGEINAVRDGSANIHVTQSGLSAVENALNNAARNRTARISVVTSAPTQARPSYALGGETGGRVSRDFGVKRLASGGRLPYTGLGTDKILGINSDGMPLALVDDLEWVVNRHSSDKYDSVLDRINRDHPSVQHLAHLRDGGRAGQLASTAMAMSQNITVSGPQIDYERLTNMLIEAAHSTPIDNRLQIDSRTFARLVTNANKQSESLGVR